MIIITRRVNTQNPIWSTINVTFIWKVTETTPPQPFQWDEHPSSNVTSIYVHAYLSWTTTTKGVIYGGQVLCTFFCLVLLKKKVSKRLCAWCWCCCCCCSWWWCGGGGGCETACAAACATAIGFVAACPYEMGRDSYWAPPPLVGGCTYWTWIGFWAKWRINHWFWQ